MFFISNQLCVSVGRQEFYKEGPEEPAVDLTRKPKNGQKDSLTRPPVSADTGRVRRGKSKQESGKTVA